MFFPNSLYNVVCVGINQRSLWGRGGGGGNDQSFTVGELKSIIHVF